MKIKEYPELDDFALVAEKNGEVWLWGFGEYPEHSVLHGQFRKQRLECFESMEQAQKAYPKVRIDAGVPLGCASVPSEPEEWFDPMNAGEAWGENDY